MPLCASVCSSAKWHRWGFHAAALGRTAKPLTWWRQRRATAVCQNGALGSPGGRTGSGPPGQKGGRPIRHDNKAGSKS